MLDNLKRLNDLDIVLGKMDEDAINQLYLRVFSSKDGELLLQDLANRAYEFDVTENIIHEGMRALYMSIISRLRLAVQPKESE